jgi:uncharacterized membrane protein
MDLTSGLLPLLWYWLAHAVLAVLVIVIGRKAPWRRLSNPALLHLWLGTIVLLSLLWSIRTGLRPGLGFHLLGAAACTLLFGRSLGFFAMLLVLAGQVLTGAIELWSFSVNALVMVAFPVALTHALLRIVQTRLPPNLFVYIFAAAFFGGALSMVATGVLGSVLLSLAGVYARDYLWSEYLLWFVLMSWAEAFVTGGWLTFAVVYRPNWVATFDERRYLSQG